MHSILHSEYLRAAELLMISKTYDCDKVRCYYLQKLRKTTKGFVPDSRCLGRNWNPSELRIQLTYSVKGCGMQRSSPTLKYFNFSGNQDLQRKFIQTPFDTFRASSEGLQYISYSLLSHYLGIWLAGLRKTTINLNQYGPAEIQTGHFLNTSDKHWEGTLRGRFGPTTEQEGVLKNQR
jgi:hypothetical protein